MNELSPESPAWDLAARVSVAYDDRVQCQCKGCGHTVFKAVHLIVWTDGRIECWGGDCYARELGATPRGKGAKPRYDFVAGRELTPEEREMLKSNREALIAKFREEQQQREQAKREYEEKLRRETEQREQAERERREAVHRADKEQQRSARPAAEQQEHPHSDLPTDWLREREGVCEICGTKTDKWCSYYGDTGTCICNNCGRQNKIWPAHQKSDAHSTSFQSTSKPAEAAKPSSQRLLWDP